MCVSVCVYTHIIYTHMLYICHIYSINLRVNGETQKLEGEGRDRNYVSTVVIYAIIKENNNSKREAGGSTMPQSPQKHIFGLHLLHFDI